jgi:hypothetical protein
MDIAAALADIDAVLKEPPEIATGGVAAVIELTNRYHGCIRRYAPPGSTWREQGDRYIAYHAKSGLNPGHDSPQAALLGVLTSLRREIANGGLAQFEELVHGDVYADLIAQGEGLHRDGYSRAGAVVAGAALEEHIKKLAGKYNTGTVLQSGSPKKASMMNGELKAAGAYGEPQRVIIESWQKLRNEAAHGEPGFDGTDTNLVASVGPMVSGIRGFVAQYPA